MAWPPIALRHGTRMGAWKRVSADLGTATLLSAGSRPLVKLRWPRNLWFCIVFDFQEPGCDPSTFSSTTVTTLPAISTATASRFYYSRLLTKLSVWHHSTPLASKLRISSWNGLTGVTLQYISASSASPVYWTLVAQGQTDNPAFAFNLAAPSPWLSTGGTNRAVYIGAKLTAMSVRLFGCSEN
ncbi:hypothetical protein PAXRUDRAFT_765289 [Paxillus rubicundulus Ve08.2h10]|uniref:Uncharacterized protein n=1 Tax=Paxillus rubicundulus Ve08.2h10 TaxID=930991 RepID=A0A0D0D9T8_9AGAM|nr:hypothetical protein PAXRUDRAFT_765289 [Paxillus rubicundulus Ve08.2h10]